MAAKASVKKGDKVEYNWGKGKAKAEVTQVHTSDVSRTIKGKTIKRHASPEEPAAEVRTKSGGRALKSASELKKR